MPFPFGCGISDFVAVGQLAYRIFVSCKEAPGVFGTISREVQSLQCVLEEAADSQLTQPLSPPRQARLTTILDGCYSVLTDLEYIIDKYQSLGTNDKSPWDRMRLGSEDIAEIRGRLVLNVTLLTAFGSLQNGQRREYGSWQWVVDLSEPSGGLRSPNKSITPSISDKSMFRSETDVSTLVDVQQEPTSPSSKTKSRPRLAAMVTGISGKKKRLVSAIDHKDSAKALDILHDEANASFIDQEVLDHALWSAARFQSVPLMEALLERGANVDAVREKKNVLWNAVSNGNEDVVRLLLRKNVNLGIDHLRAALKSDSMMQILVKAGAPIEAEYQISSAVHMNILQEATSKGYQNIMHTLLSNGAKIDACSQSHGTALMIASSMGRESISKYLIQKGANVNLTRTAEGPRAYTNPVEAAIVGRKPALLDLLFKAGAVTDMPQAMKFAQARSDYPLIPSAGSQYGYDYDGTQQFYRIMVMLAQRDLRYVCFFRKDESMEVKRLGMRKMMQDLCK